MTVTYTKEYKDPNTGQTHKAGEQAEVSDEQGKKLIQEGAARQGSGGQQSGQQR